LVRWFEAQRVEDHARKLVEFKLLAVVEAYAENNGNSIKIVQGITGSRNPTHNSYNIY